MLKYSCAFPFKVAPTLLIPRPRPSYEPNFESPQTLEHQVRQAVKGFDYADLRSFSLKSSSNSTVDSSDSQLFQDPDPKRSRLSYANIAPGKLRKKRQNVSRGHSKNDGNLIEDITPFNRKVDTAENGVSNETQDNGGQLFTNMYHNLQQANLNVNVVGNILKVSNVVQV